MEESKPDPITPEIRIYTIIEIRSKYDFIEKYKNIKRPLTTAEKIEILKSLSMWSKEELEELFKRLYPKTKEKRILI
jgi:nitrogenase subunit NifH